MLVVIGCGNANRSDDGVGVVVAQALQRRLSEQPRAGVKVFDGGTGGMDVMFQARGASRLVIVDASRSGSEPGAVFEVPGEELQADYEPSLSLHDFRWDHALAAGRRIFREQFPREVSVWLIEAQSLDFGLELSAPVRAAAARVIERLAGEIDALPPAAEVVAGSVHLPREACQRWLPGIESVALLEREGALLLLPLVRDSAGGLLLKQRNARGDRVVQAQEFFRSHGYAEDHAPQPVSLRWDEAAAALVLEGLRRTGP